MKLKNKKTGEIKEVIVGGYPVSGKTKMWECSEMDINEETGYKSLGTYKTLAELNEEWEDYEEPEYYYFIQDDGRIGCDAIDPYNHKSKLEEHKQIGNYFESREEAEKAVEKLEAWRRLKDNGFKISHWYSVGKGCLNVNIKFDKYAGILEDDKKDLDLLFGGEE